MHRLAILLVPCLACGCYLSHGRAERARDAALAIDAGRAIDAGSDRDAARPIDASARDAGPPDGGSVACALAPFGEVQVRNAMSHSTQAPDLAWTGAELAVVMMEGGGTLGHPIVTLAHVAPDLSRVSEHVLVGEEAHGWGEITWLGDALGLCWHGDPGGPGRTMFRRVFDRGARLGARADLDPAGEACLDVAHVDGRVIVGLRHRAEAPEGFVIETRALVLDLDGNPVAEPLTLASDAYPGRNVQLTARGDHFLAALSPSNGVAQVLVLSRDGAILAERSFEVADARGVVVSTAHDRVALLVGCGPAEARSLRLLVLDEGLAPIGEARALSDGAPSTIGGTLAVLPDGWLVAWAEEERPSTSMTLLHLDVDGAAREPRIRAYDGPNSGYGGPAIAVDGANAYVGLSHHVDGREPDQTFVSGWHCGESDADPCAPQEIIEGDCDGAERPRWIWNGEACLPVLCPSACSGRDCERLAPSVFACRADHAACGPGLACDAGRLEVGPLVRACGTSRVAREPDYVALRVEAATDCPCATQLHCDVRVIEPFRIALDVYACVLDVACACGPRGEVSTECRLPALSAGTWSVEPAGLAPFPLDVRAPWETITEGPAFCTDDE